MATSKPNVLATCYEGRQGDREFIFAYKLLMTDLQCVKFHYGAQKLRILGKVSMTVQCIVDGVPVGNMSYKAHVVQDIYQLFDTHSIAGSKMSENLIGRPYQLLPEVVTKPTEPTFKIRKRKKSKANGGGSVSSNSPVAEPSKPAPFDSPRSSVRPWSSSSLPAPVTPPRPLVQGRWVKKFWCTDHCNNPDQVTCYYVDRVTGEEHHVRPDCWESEGSMHSPTSARSWVASADEYEDYYTNESTIMKVPPAASKAASQRPYTLADQRLVHRMWKEARSVPDHLQHVPVPHGANWCHPDCLHLGDVPEECGYHLRWGRIVDCGPDCAGNWCSHMRSMPGRDWMS